MEQKHIHRFADTVVPSTCKENGYTLHKCHCGYEHKDNFMPLGAHNFQLAEEKLPTCTEYGNLILYADYNSDGVLTGKTIKEYEQNSVTTIEVQYGENGDEISRSETHNKFYTDFYEKGKISYEYDENGDLEEIEEEVYNEDGKVIFAIEYDQYGVLAEKIVREYDEQGNVTLRAYYNPMGILDSKIEYSEPVYVYKP